MQETLLSPGSHPESQAEGLREDRAADGIDAGQQSPGSKGWALPSAALLVDSQSLPALPHWLTSGVTQFLWGPPCPPQLSGNALNGGDLSQELGAGTQPSGQSEASTSPLVQWSVLDA